jgi:LysR family transcriptional activator of nhaA
VLNFNHLYYFHIVAAEGSVKAAADRLGVTQPTISEQLRMLERSLGVQLFERTPSGLKLTPKGRDVSEHTSAMFLAGERLVESLGRDGQPVSVVLRIGVSAATARTIAADFLMPVLTVENCRPSIRSGDFNELLRDLRSRELDLVIGETEPLDVAGGGFEVKRIYQPSLVAIGVPDVAPKDDWSDLSLLEFRSSSVYHWEVQAYLHEKGLRPKIMAELDDAFLMVEAVARGGFVAFVPFSVAHEALRGRRVKQLAEIRPDAAGVYAVYPTGDAYRLAREAVERLIEGSRERATGA